VEKGAVRKRFKAERMELIDMRMIDRPVKIARETIDPERVRELAESIRESGLQQPIKVRPVNGRFEIVFGDRRYLAHKLLELKTIKAIVTEMDDQETVVIRGIENLQRENLSPSEEAATYMALKSEGGLGVMAIAKRTGKSPQTIKRYLDFGGYPEEVRRAVDQKKITLNVLELLREIEDPDAFKYHFEMAAANGVTTAVARLWVDDYLKAKAGTYYSDIGALPPGGTESAPRPVYMTCECCLGAVEMKDVRSVVVCIPCLKKVRHA
jgi:ParB family chromosome partitioning protein